jgi:hypothetical protein
MRGTWGTPAWSGRPALQVAGAKGDKHCRNLLWAISLLDLCGGEAAFFAVDVGDGEGPEGNEVDAGDELGGAG